MYLDLVSIQSVFRFIEQKLECGNLCQLRRAELTRIAARESKMHVLLTVRFDVTSLQPEKKVA